MILNDTQLAEKNLMSPFTDHKVSEVQGRKVLSFGCSPFSYDISLADHDFRIFRDNAAADCMNPYSTDDDCIDPKGFDANFLEPADLITPHKDLNDSYFLLPAQTYALGVSRELFSIPDNVLGIATGKSTYARCGIIINITPLEPGWKGFLTIELFNCSRHSTKIYANEGIAALIFLEGDKPNQKYNGKYQNQGSRVVPAL